MRHDKAAECSVSGAAGSPIPTSPRAIGVTMNAVVHFHTDFYGPQAVRVAALKYSDQASFELAETGADLVARLQPSAATSEIELEALRGEFCNEALRNAARELRVGSGGASRGCEPAGTGMQPRWQLLAPFTAGTALALGWVLDSLGPIRAGVAIMVLRHEQHGSAQVSIRRNNGTPCGVAHTDTLDFLLLNGGGGSAPTEGSIERVLKALAKALRVRGNKDCDAFLDPPPALDSPRIDDGSSGARQTRRRVTPRIDVAGNTVSFEFDDCGFDRLALYDAAIAVAETCYVFLSRTGTQRAVVQLKPRAGASADGLRVLARDATRAFNQLARREGDNPRHSVPVHSGGMPVLQRRQVDLEGLLTELEAADPWQLGLGFEPERGPGHEGLRVLNILGKGACDSDCVFCCEKFNPLNRLTPSTDATQQLILDSAHQFDMLFFASGEPTIHPRLFEYVDLARSVGFTCFGMSSHFRTFSDAHFTLRTLQAGFQYFDISLHAADLASQLEINPIDDGGASLPEALKGLAVLCRLAEALGIRISVTHKIVVSRHNVTRLDQIFRATYDRGVRHFIVQPVRVQGLASERVAMLAIEEEEILPYLNEFIERTKGLGVVVKPYGFSRRDLLRGDHIESEQNRVKNASGRARGPQRSMPLPQTVEARPTDGRHWIELRSTTDERFGFAADAGSVVLDEALRRGAGLTFGCRMGSCGMCCARLLEGRVDQSTQIFLTDEQVRDGYVLLCQARPLSDVTLKLCTDDEIDPL